MNNRILLYFLFSFVLFFCCSNKASKNEGGSKELYTNDMTDIEDEDQYFLQNQDGNIYISYGVQLRTIYKRLYSNAYSDFHSFKVALLKSSLTSPLPKGMRLYDDSGEYCDLYEEQFQIDSTVMADYQNSSLDIFISRYCEKNNDRLVIKTPNTKKVEPYNKRMTIAYCMWKSGYYFNNDCYSGNESFEWDSDCHPLKSQSWEQVSD